VEGFLPRMMEKSLVKVMMGFLQMLLLVVPGKGELTLDEAQVDLRIW